MDNKISTKAKAELIGVLGQRYRESSKMATTQKLHRKHQYYLMGEFLNQTVKNVTIISWADLGTDPKYESMQEQTYKSSQQNFGANNYPRPCPYIYHKQEIWDCPVEGDGPEDIGVHHITISVQQDWT